MTTHGALLLRGFEVEHPAELREIVEVLAPGALLDYTERSSPRSTVEDKVFTATDHPAHQDILLHNENSYQERFPRLVAFWCQQPAASGGRTTLADTRSVYQRIPVELRARFESLGLRYIRRFGVGVGLDWEEAFGLRDRGAVGQYCRRHGLTPQWDGPILTTTAHRSATLFTLSGISWFNHAVFFHPRSLPGEVRELMYEQFGADGLPNDVRYGDGSAIEDTTIDAIRSAYDADRVEVAWQRGDVVLLDNTIVAHGRGRFTGKRSILVSMAGAQGRRRASEWI